MARLIELSNYADFQPLLHDLFKTGTIMLVTEIMLYLFSSDPIMDKIFVRLLAFTLLGTVVFYFVTNQIIGVGGSGCCVLNLPKLRGNANANANAEKNSQNA